ITGTKAYFLSGGNITRQNLTTGTAYLITYWKRDSTGTVTVNSGNGVQVASRNGWILYSHEITGASTITVSGTAVIDELRLYPKTAQMSTLTYLPMMGVQSQCDPNNKIIYYEYDDFGRLSFIRDEDKNILKRFCYNYAGQPQDCGQ